VEAVKSSATDAVASVKDEAGSAAGAVTSGGNETSDDAPGPEDPGQARLVSEQVREPVSA
jgi:hypothetical protein